MKRKNANRALLFLLLILTALSSFPLFIMISFSLRDRNLVFASLLFPTKPTLSNYATIFRDQTLMRYLMNSIVLSISVAMIAILVSIITGYGFSRFQFKFKSILLYFMFATRMFPPILVAVGFFKVFIRLGLYNNLFGLIMVNSAMTLPFSIWMMKGYFDRIPKSIDEAAMIDGCSRINVCFRVVVPISSPGIVAVGIWSFVFSWGEYLYANTFISSVSKQMITTGLVDLLGHFIIQWGLVMAYAIIISAPILILFVFLQQYFVSGLTEGGVKG
jgi:multiple sugar transport system permease protein